MYKRQGYDEYRYDLANIGHNPHELASYLTAKYQSYTLSLIHILAGGGVALIGGTLVPLLSGLFG